MAGVELVADRAQRRPYPASERRAQRVCRVARDHGVFLRPLGDTLVLVPPLSIQPEEIDQIREALAVSIEAVCGDAR
jgi:adenosylmethionine-8-amino-7-oxononanoate aminotransferase